MIIITIMIIKILIIMIINNSGHGLSQQGVWVPFWTPKEPLRTPKYFCVEFLKIPISSL